LHVDSTSGMGWTRIAHTNSKRHPPPTAGEVTVTRSRQSESMPRQWPRG
jgi:hypothetical protein